MKVVLLAAQPQVKKVYDITQCPVVVGTSKLLYLIQYLRKYCEYPENTPMYLVNYTRKAGPGVGAVDVTSEFEHLLGLSPFWNHVFQYRGVLVRYKGKNIFYDVSILTENTPEKHEYSITDDSRSDYDVIQIYEDAEGMKSKIIRSKKI